KEYILKDVWVYEDTPLEGETRGAIFTVLKAKDKAERTTHATDAEPYFMTFAHDWKVQSEHLPPGDCTPSVPEGWKPTQFSRQHQALANSDSPAQWTASMQVSAPVAVPLKRIHVRTVFEEVCQTLYEITDYMEYIVQIVQGRFIQALRYMCLAGFVHRDISPGNCLWHAPLRQAKISDLEYARPFSELSGHDPWTGTPPFMAVEYQAQMHLFLKSPGSINMVKLSKLTPSPRFFTFNFYHDLESVFWLYTWFLHKCPPARLTLGDDARKVLVQSYTNHLDCGIVGTALRASIILADAGVHVLAGELVKVYGNTSFLLNGLGSVSIIRDAYEVLEATEPRRNHEGKPSNLKSTIFDWLTGQTG
ncbi:hypothetical protein DFH06DRAFT_977041, partial [Mycena polygramma]